MNIDGPKSLKDFQKRIIVNRVLQKTENQKYDISIPLGKTEQNFVEI